MKILISYDVSGIEDGNALERYIKSKYPNYWHGLDGTWIVSSMYSPRHIRDCVRGFLKVDGNLLVVDISGSQASWGGLNVKSANWLKDNL
ncbi:MAG: hypothetical protein V4536_02940 [Pseudomonadota bacterium]